MKEIDDDNNNSTELKSSSITWIFYGNGNWKRITKTLVDPPPPFLSSRKEFIQKTRQSCVRINHLHYQPRLGNCSEELSTRKIFLFFAFTPNDSTSEGSFVFPTSRYAQYPDVRTIWWGTEN